MKPIRIIVQTTKLIKSIAPLGGHQRLLFGARQPTNPHHLPCHRIIQNPTFGFDEREPVAGTGDADLDQLPGDNRFGRLR